MALSSLPTLSGASVLGAAVESEDGRPIGILVDLQGPKLRVGAFKDGSAEIDSRQHFALDADAAPGDANRVQLPQTEIISAIKEGDTLSSMTASCGSRPAR